VDTTTNERCRWETQTVTVPHTHSTRTWSSSLSPASDHSRPQPVFCTALLCRCSFIAATTRATPPSAMSAERSAPCADRFHSTARAFSCTAADDAKVVIAAYTRATTGGTDSSRFSDALDERLYSRPRTFSTTRGMVPMASSTRSARSMPPMFATSRCTSTLLARFRSTEKHFSCTVADAACADMASNTTVKPPASTIRTRFLGSTASDARAPLPRACTPA
jgi:hypothetical protein